MMFPTLGEVRRIVARVRNEEGLSIRTVLEPREVARLMIKYRFLHFLITGVCGLGFGLTVMWVLTTFVLGLERYFTAYLIGAAVTLSFNFTVYSFTVFRTTQTHAMRFLVYAFYNIGMTGLQAMCIKVLTPYVGIQWYLGVVVGVVTFFSLLNYTVFKLSLFRERL